MTLPTLTEWQTMAVPDMTVGLARFLRDHCGKYVSVDRDPFDPTGCWKLTPGNWIGSIPLLGGEVLRIRPKLPVPSLLRLLDLAYGFTKLDFHPDITACDSIEDWFDRLVAHLVRRIRVRMRRGLYRAYIPRRERMSHVRGRLVLRPLITRPHDPTLVCDYHEHTPNIADNQILAWTMHLAARCQACSTETRHQTQALARALTQTVPLVPCSAHECLGRTYHRLNQDYEPLHIVCRLILDRLSPTWEAGDDRSLPFTLDMAALFEEAVANWLKARLPTDRYRVVAQDRFTLGRTTDITYVADIVIYDRQDGSTLAVLDTKYKLAEDPSNADVNQVLAYGMVLKASRVGLIYPQTLIRPIDTVVGSQHTHFKTLSFPVELTPDQAGQQLLDRLGLGEIR